LAESSNPGTLRGTGRSAAYRILEAWEELASALLGHARQYEVVEIVPTPFGRNFVVEGALPAPDGRSPKVRVIWFIAKNAETATLATAYPLDI
jgi:hypothetical protein